MIALQQLAANGAFAFGVHVAVSTFVLLCALAAASLRSLTARTRHTILAAALCSLAFPPALFAWLIEKLATAPVRRVALALPHFVPAATQGAIDRTSSIPWLGIAAAPWLGVAALLVLRWIIVSRRLNLSALKLAAAPQPRAVAALEAARRRLSLHRSVDLVASPLCEAPAVIRVLRPVIVLPTHGCDALDDEELQSLLCHECAHVARRDNLLGVFEGIVYAVFWFNPVVWLARRQIAIAREAACDELVADTAARAETYVGALAKFCSSLIAPALPAVSCMASAHLKERIRHIMRYDSLKKGALSHRAIAATASFAVALFIIGAGVATAHPETNSSMRFLFNYSTAVNDDGGLTIRAKIVDTREGKVLGEPTLITKPGAPAAASIESGNVRVRMEVVPDAAGGGGAVDFTAFEDGEVVQRSHFNVNPEADRSPKYQGEKISLDLKDADMKDVLKTFGKITGIEMNVDSDVTGKVTMHFVETPWDEALDRMLHEHGLAYKIDGHKMHVFVKH